MEIKIHGRLNTATKSSFKYSASFLFPPCATLIICQELIRFGSPEIGSTSISISSEENENRKIELRKFPLKWNFQEVRSGF